MGVVSGKMHCQISSIAIFRVLHVKAQTFLTTKIKVSRLLPWLFIFGLSHSVALSLIIVFLDDEVPVRMLCTHRSMDDILIMRDYMVRTGNVSKV